MGNPYLDKIRLLEAGTSTFAVYTEISENCKQQGSDYAGLSTGVIAERLPITYAEVEKALKALRASNLVTSTPLGTINLWSLK